MPAPLQISYSLANIESAAHQLWQYGHQYRVWAFSGEMGAGKTTLIHTLCDVLGVADAVSSPTFAIINEYTYQKDNIPQRLYHMDWYRLRDTQEALNAGVEDVLLDNQSHSLVEWPERVRELLPFPHLWIAITETAPGERSLTATPSVR